MNVITIDGPSGVGKTAIGLALSEEYQLPFLSIGMFYRSLAWAQRQNHDPLEAASELQFTFRSLESGAIQALPVFREKILDQELFTDPAIELLTADLAQREEIRQKVNALIQKASAQGAIAEGRSASVLFQTQASLYLTAHSQERARRQNQEKKRLGASFATEQVQASNQIRDQKDQKRKIAPLRLLSHHIAWDSTYHSLAETSTHIKRWLAHHLGLKPLTVSVIIPVFNRADHLYHTLEHLKKQTLSPSLFEIIVVNDGSSDHSGKVARSFNVQLLETAHAGPAAARNRGIEMAQGEILLFLDADILVKPDFIEKVLLLHSHTNNLVLLGARRHLAENSTSITSENIRLDSREKLLFRNSFALHHLRHPWSLAYTCNLSMPRHLIERESFDETFTGWGLEDIEFAYRLFKKGGRFAYSRRAMGYHLYHDRSSTPQRYAAWLKNLELMKGKHSDPAIHSFDLFKAVFDPQIQADYFQTFDRFDPPRQREAEMLDLSGFSGDPLAAIQQKWGERGIPIKLLDHEEHTLYEVFLPFLEEQVCSFSPKGGLE